MPADVGFCRGHTERFYHDSATKECKTFIWGGCLGNANNFATKEDCLAACGSAPVGVMLLGSSARGAARIDGGDQPMSNSNNNIFEKLNDFKSYIDLCSFRC